MNSLPHLQHQLRHLEAFLQALVVRHRLVEEQAQQVVPLQGLLVVALVNVQNPILPVKVWELQTFLGSAVQNQSEAEAGPKNGQQDVLHR